jgi:ankyrin repeat protein
MPREYNKENTSALQAYLETINDVSGQGYEQGMFNHKIAHLVVKGNADPNVAKSSGSTALSLAAMYGNDTTAYSLIASGANIEVTGYQGYTPLMNACAKGHDNVPCLRLVRI